MNKSFAKAITETKPCIPNDVINKGSRFNVYRNNYIVGLVGNLDAKFPVTKRLVGQEYFEALAKAFIAEWPPASPILASYGDSFADFVENFPPLSSLPYLSDVARIEWARIQALNVIHHPVAIVTDSTSLELALEMPVRLATSATLIRSGYPVNTIWERNQTELVTPISQWEPEVVVVWGRDGYTHQKVIPADVSFILTGMKGDASFLDTLSSATDEKKLTYLIGVFTSFLNQGILVPYDLEHGEIEK